MATVAWIGILDAIIGSTIQYHRDIMFTRVGTIAANDNRMIALVYLANDIIQSSREFADVFGSTFPAVLQQAMSVCSKPNVDRIRRCVSIWAERQVFAASYIEHLKSILGVSSTDLPPSPLPPAIAAVSNRHLHNIEPCFGFG